VWQDRVAYMFLLFPSTPPIDMVSLGWVASSLRVPGILLKMNIFLVYFLYILLHHSTKMIKRLCLKINII
jgi:hypothetical protein